MCSRVTHDDPVTLGRLGFLVRAGTRTFALKRGRPGVCALFFAMRMPLVVVFLWSCGASETAPEPLHLNSLSVLFPLPPPGHHDQLLGPADSGAKGPLLPADIYALAPPLVQRRDPAELYSHLRVVSARFDPCFPDLAAAPENCEMQLRLVLQPLEAVAGVTTTEDAALHLFYAIDWPSVHADLSALQNLAPESTAEGPLSIHPSLASQGLNGPYGQGLRELILTHAGTDNLIQMTFMRVKGFVLDQWDFGGFELVQRQPVAIVGVATATQTFVNVAGISDEDYVGRVAPEPNPADNIIPAYDSLLFRRASAEVRQNVAVAVLRLEHPGRHHPKTVDCVSCHVANGAHLWLDRNYPELNLRQHPERYQSSLNLALVTQVPRLTAPLRAFGYFDNKVAIAQRTVNETAAIAEFLAR